MSGNYLIIDDEKVIREGLINYLVSLGKSRDQLFQASSGQQALICLEKSPIHAAFVDINLLDINGLDLIKLINKRFPKILIVIISGFDEFDFARRAIKLNVFDYLLKPVPKTDLEKLLFQLEEEIQKSVVHTPEAEAQTGACSLADKGKFYIESHYMDDSLSLKSAANSLFVSDSYLSRQMKLKFQESFSEYLIHYRLQKAVELLENPELQYTIAEISRKVGYKDQHYFSRLFKKKFGYAPLHYQKSKEKISG